MGDEDFIERRGSAVRRAVEGAATKRPMIFLLGGAMLGAAFSPAPVIRVAAPVAVAAQTPVPSPTPAEEPAPEPTPEPEPAFSSDGEPAVDVQALTGKGPFLIFSFAGRAETALYAYDVSQPSPRTPLKLGVVAGDFQVHSVTTQFGGSAYALMTREDDGTHRIWIVSRGARALRRVATFQETVTSMALSPDGREIVTLLAENETDATMWITSTANGASRRVALLRNVRNAGDPSEDLHIQAWDQRRRRMLGVERCHCDGGMGYSTQYALTMDGALSEHQLDVPLGDVGVSGDGASFAFTTLPDGVDCFEVNCAAVEHALRVATVTGGSGRVLARASRPTFQYPRLSPDGSLVAYGTGSTIEVLRVSDGRLVATTDMASEPVAWIDNQRLIVNAVTAESGGTNVDVITFGPTLRSMPQSTEIAAGEMGLSYLGWLR